MHTCIYTYMQCTYISFLATSLQIEQGAIVLCFNLVMLITKKVRVVRVGQGYGIILLSIKLGLGAFLGLQELVQPGDTSWLGLGKLIRVRQTN